MDIPKTQYLQPLVSAGLEPDQAEIYELLLKNGPLKAGKIAQKSPLKRGLVYKILDELVDMGLVIKNEPANKVAVFEPAHPLKLKDLAQSREQKLKTAQLALDGIMGQLSSDYNLSLNKPGVQYFEGMEGIKKVIYDNLSSKTEILSYLDMTAIDKYIPEINKEYVATRERLKLKKRNLVNDTPENRARLATYHRGITEIRLMRLKNADIHFASMIQIYDDKISYITLDTKHLIGVIIQDRNIVEMHRQLYLYTWQFAEPLPAAA
jgi:sugar-specific transcriptional regulator TrmB